MVKSLVPSCSCADCNAGKHTPSGQARRRSIFRALRASVRRQLRRVVKGECDDVVEIQHRGGYFG